MVEDWWEQVGEKSSLGWYGRVKKEFTVEEYVKVLDSYVVRLRFRLSSLLLSNCLALSITIKASCTAFSCDN